MAVYIVTWNLNKEKNNYNAARTAFIQQLETYSNKSDSGLESVRFIETTQTASEVSDFLRKKMDSNDRLFITKLVSGNHQGWLSKDVWDWINARI